MSDFLSYCCDAPSICVLSSARGRRAYLTLSLIQLPSDVFCAIEGSAT